MADTKRLAIPSKESQLIVVGPKNYLKAPRIQRFTKSTDIPSTIIDEIGSRSHAGEAKDTPNVTLSFSAFDVGIKLFSVLTGTDWTAYPAGGVDFVNLGEMDAIVYVKSDTTEDYVRSGHARKLQIRDMALNYSVDGESTEDYTAIGSERRWFQYDVIVDRFTVAGTSATLAQTPLQLKNGNYAISVIVDGKYFTETSGVPAAGEYRLNGVGNKTLTLGTALVTQAMVVYHANPAGTNWADVLDASMPAAIKGRDVKIKIAANDIVRVQSVSINGTLNTQPVRQMGSRTVTGYQRQVPSVDGTITVLDTDTELINLLMYGTVTTSGVVEWTMGDLCPSGVLALSIQLIDPCDETGTSVLKEVYLDNIVVTGENWSVNVNGNAQLQVPFRSQTGHLVIYSGAKP